MGPDVSTSPLDWTPGGCTVQNPLHFDKYIFRKIRFPETVRQVLTETGNLD